MTLPDLRQLVPGLLLSAAVAAAAYGIAYLEELMFGRAWLEPLVVAILLGALVSNVARLSDRFDPGVNFGAKQVLELAVALLGLSLTAQALHQLGLSLLVGVPLLVGTSILGGYAVSRLFGLNHRLSVLVATGNSVCGNSAIAAVAPIIGAKREEVAAAISLTAIIGVAVVLLLPLFGLAVNLDRTAYAVFTGLTVYAVPQVIAAAAPFGGQAVVLATLVKLARVVMLGPITLCFSLMARRRAAQVATTGKRPALLPWFVIGFVLLAVLNSVFALPKPLLHPIKQFSTLLTIIAMAALGLGVDARALKQVGPPVAFSTTASLLVVGALAFALVKLLTL